jgi:hypothetical protein
MKHVGSLISKLAAYGVTLVVTALVATAQAGTDTAKVMAVRGQAQFSEAGGPWMALKVGATLNPGSVVKTAANSQVDLFLKVNGPMVRVTADTTLGLTKLYFEETGAETVIDTQLDLSNGRILGNVKKMAAASKYDVKVPTGTVGIRGTQYDISTTGTVTVLTGSVLVTYIAQNGTTTQVTVNAGQTWNPPTAANGPVQPPVPTPTGIIQEITPQFPEMESNIPEVVVTPGGAVIVVQPEPPPVSPTQGQK